MFKWLRIVTGTLRSLVKCHRDLALENLALRQQLAVLKHAHPRPQLSDADRVFWILLSKIWAGWRSTLHVVQPETEVATALRSPWQIPYAERVIGSIRRECLDHVIVLSTNHLRRILSSYAAYYNGTRTHLSLSKDAPEARIVQPPVQGVVRELEHVGGLHHEYVRMAA